MLHEINSQNISLNLQLNHQLENFLQIIFHLIEKDLKYFYNLNNFFKNHIMFKDIKLR
jgi:hypothetical protein